VEGIVNHNAYALLAVTETECSAKINLIAKIVLSDQLLKLLYHLTGSLNVAGATNTNYNFHDFFLAIYLFFYFNL
jgi:hypothetical protein